MTRIPCVMALLLCACGGQVSTEAGDGAAPKPNGNSSSGADGSSGNPDAANAPDSPTVTIDASTGVTCSSGPSSGTGSSSGCQTSATETCSDGTIYQVTCTCPAATCSCTQSSSNSGSSGAGIPFDGCPSCSSTTSLFTACGFPQ